VNTLRKRSRLRHPRVDFAQNTILSTCFIYGFFHVVIYELVAGLMRFWGFSPSKLSWTDPILIFRLLSLAAVHRIFGNKLQGMGEYSESRSPPFWSLAQELMAQSIATFTARYLVGPLPSRFLDFGQRIFVYGKIKGRPWSVVAKLGLGTEEVVSALRALVSTCIKVVSKFLPSGEGAKRHDGKTLYDPDL